jgi:hypothetical protein
MSLDPIRFAGGLNLYQYAASDPIGNVDPSGLTPGSSGGVMPLEAWGGGQQRPLTRAEGREVIRSLVGLVDPGLWDLYEFRSGYDWANERIMSPPERWGTLPGIIFPLASGNVTRVWVRPLWSCGKAGTPAANALQHWNKHRAEFPELENSLQYVQRAHELLRTTRQGIQRKTRKNGEILLYDPNTNTFAAYSPDGAPKTMFRPKNGMQYWNSQ